MPILADLKQLVEVQMKLAKHRDPKLLVPTPREKVMLLTRVLYEKKTLQQACDELQINMYWGQRIWSEHLSQYNKSKKLYKKSASKPKTAGVRMLAQGQRIQKMRIRVKIQGRITSEVFF